LRSVTSRASKVARDVTERKQSEALQRLLVGELNHRVKNTLATIQAIARQSLRSEPNPSAFVASFNGRIQALARAHDLLIRGQMQRAELADLVREQVDLGNPDPRVSASGPLVRLDSRLAVQMALVLHELATNARKYGALSVATGRLEVTWTLSDGAERELRVTWRERGVPRVTVPERHGFGTLLIQRSLVANGGDTGIRYCADGLVCEICLPLPAEATGGPSGIAKSDGVETPSQPALLKVAGRRILVVEDEPLIAMDIEDKLLAAGCEVVGPAATVATALRLASELAIDAALLDANLGGHPVDELAAELARRGIPFAFVSGFGRQSLPIPFQDARLLTKPFGGEELIEMVRSLVDLEKPEAGVVRLRPARS
jgi:two-component sensor histidine kinase